MVDEEMAGQPVPLHREGYDGVVYVPATPDEFESALGDRLPDAWGKEGLPGGRWMLKMPVFAVRVWGEADVSAPGFRDQPHAAEIAGRFRSDTFGVASRVAARFLDWTRTARRQSWLSLHGERPNILDVEVWDEDAGQRLPFGVIETTVVHHGDRGFAITREDLAPLVAYVESDDDIAVAEALLADAEHFLTNSPPDVRRAVLMAAVSCEVRVKETMKALASREQMPLVEALLDNPRDWSLAASSLFDKGLAAIGGASLRETNKPVFKRVVTLFEVRNRVAHGGARPSEDEARDVVQAARAAVDWLGGLTDQRPATREETDT